ncbi:Predicted DNA-binding transcriptional regulator YafY, contains an HTH and WYL domains [Paenibacillus algorifonticola]|uniref:Predicted DNA-binding transcriptional regulator YafY, contains an HTH and WYL domains n=1 Tax=Paenibacillus algorifonticola TaxID=684063 RepID=A0A1I2IHC6_9BACL|nr:YafY family protein [Paenibacillus algorifonticola]SFF41739.1 Predicted DNA-binding transcriptional regulator YafY, contains an HTH and WYL domains [Paenibacillus algorifonticola]
MKIDRLLGIVVLLLGRKRWNATELAERFEVSIKTIYRDMETLGLAGIPVASHHGAAGGYEIMEQYTLNRQLASAKEWKALLAAVKGIASALNDQAYHELLTKVNALLPQAAHEEHGRQGEELVLDLQSWGSGLDLKPKLALLQQAITESRVIHLRYASSAGNESERAVEPAALIMKGSVWYVQAYCRGKQGFRMFRLTRILGLSLMLERFEPRQSPQLEGLIWRSDWAVDQETPMLLLFQPQVKHRVYDAFPSVFITELADGSLQVAGSFSLDEWFYGLLLSFCQHVRVLAPAYAAEEVKRRAQLIFEIY